MSKLLRRWRTRVLDCASMRADRHPSLTFSTAVTALMFAAVLAFAQFALSGETAPAELGSPVPLLAEQMPASSPLLPEWLPQYTMDVHLDAGCRTATVKQTIHWTNPKAAPTDRVVLRVYPRHAPNKKELMVYQRTLESFRLNPRHAVDCEGRRFHLESLRVAGADAPHWFDDAVDTMLTVQLPTAVGPGESIDISLDYHLDLPEVQGRIGRYMGVTNLLNWYPLVAYYGEDGWDAPPYVAWHQPWLNEAGNYDVTLRLPRGEIVASGGQVHSVAVNENGEQVVRITGNGLRDLAIVTSKRFETHEDEVDGIRVRVHAFPEHRYHAKNALRTATESLAMFKEMFGPYPHPEFTVSEAYFGWNGNETAGMVLIDARVFDAPKMGELYVDQLISHEVCHQWWYGAVGTDGFRETWMDEGLVSYINDIRAKKKYGPQAKLLEWPRYCQWAPNIEYHTLQHNGFHLYHGRGGDGSVLAPLPEIGHVHNLFFLAYDKGSKVVGMIHQRLGDEKFFAFLQSVYCKYRYRVMFVRDFQSELETFTGEDWDEFFNNWLRSPKVSDWKIDRVKVEPNGAAKTTTVRVSQRRDLNEPVEIGVQDQPDGPITKFLLDPDAQCVALEDATVQKTGEKSWEVTFTRAEPPCQVILDPDQRVLDVNPANNRWKNTPAIKFTPLYSPIEEAAITRPFDRPSFVWGPGIDIDGRYGLFGSLMSPYKYRISPLVAYEVDEPFLSAGFDAQFYNVPLPNVALGARYEHTLYTTIPNAPWDNGKLYLQWNQLYTTSFIYPNLCYTELYFRFGDNFFPDPDVRQPILAGVENYQNIRSVGVSFRLNTEMPYWNPEQGFRIDADYEYGFVAFGGGETFNRVSGQLAAVHRLPDGLGYFSDTRVAGRVAGGVGSPTNGEHFRLGGSTRFRGFRSEDKEGAAFWLASLEYRLPISSRLNLPVCDNVANLRSLYGSVFYDVGDSYLFSTSLGVDHAVGVGLYFNVALLSFVEQLGMRVELAHSIIQGTDMCWFGLFHAF